MEITVTTNAPAAAAAIEELVPATVRRVRRVVVESGALLQAAVKRHASAPRTSPRPGDWSGTEGPRLLTGGYVRSIGRRDITGPTSFTASVGTNDARAMRLENGFMGADAAGRVYDQQAYPHFAPALDEVKPAFEAAIAEALTPTPGATP